MKCRVDVRVRMSEADYDRLSRSRALLHIRDGSSRIVVEDGVVSTTFTIGLFAPDLDVASARGLSAIKRRLAVGEVITGALSVDVVGVDAIEVGDLDNEPPLEFSKAELKAIRNMFQGNRDYLQSVVQKDPTRQAARDVADAIYRKTSDELAERYFAVQEVPWKV